MSCYTWYYNKFDDISKHHLNLLKKKLIDSTKYVSQYPTFKDWIESETEEDLIYYYNSRLQEVLKYNIYSDIEYCRKKINKASDPAHRGYKKSVWKKYNYKQKKIRRLSNKKIHKNELLRLISEYVSYDKIYYDLGDVKEFRNTFRIYDDNAEPWYCLDDFIQYIQEHPNCVWRYKYNENNERIKYNGKEAEDEAIVIVKDFFTKYPNGQIHLG